MPTYSNISSFRGRIQQILLVLPGIQEKISREQIELSLSGIINAFPQDVEVMLLMRRAFTGNPVEDRKLALAAENVKAGYGDRFRIIVEPEDKLNGRTGDADRWAQDPFVVQKDHSGNYRLLEPYYFSRAAQDVADRVAANLNFPIQPCPFFLEGGNMFMMDDFAVIGADLLHKNLAWYYPHLSHAKGKLKLENELGKYLGVSGIYWLGLRNPIRFQKLKMGVVGDTWQPFYHLDLFLTPGIDASGKPLFFIGKPNNESRFGTCKGLENDIETLTRSVDQIQYSLEHNSKNSFRTVEIPLPLAFQSGSFRTIYSYNNAHVEVEQLQRTIYFPSYVEEDSPQARRFRAIESEVQKSFRSVGFSPIPVRAPYEMLTKKLGALHCLVKVLKRKPVSL